jgi:hypothetical protein
MTPSRNGCEGFGSLLRLGISDALLAKQRLGMDSGQARGFRTTWDDVFGSISIKAKLYAVPVVTGVVMGLEQALSIALGGAAPEDLWLVSPKGSVGVRSACPGCLTLQ